MSTLSQIELDTRPAEEAGQRMGSRLMRGVRKGFKGKDLAGEIMSELFDEIQAGQWTPTQLYNSLRKTIRAHGSAKGLSSHLVDESLQVWERDYKNALGGTDVQKARFLQKVVGQLATMQADILPAIVDKTLEKAQKQLKRYTSKVGDFSERGYIRRGFSNQTANRGREAAMSNFEKSVNNAIVYKPDGSVDVAASKSNFDNIVTRLGDREKQNRAEEAAYKDRKIAEKQADKESRAEQKMINRILTQQDRFYAAQGYNAADRAAALDANNQQYQRQKGVTHRAHMDYLKGELTRAKQDNEDLAQDRKDAKEVERLQREARKYAEKVWNKYAQSERMSGASERFLHTTRNLFDTWMQNDIARVGTSLSLSQFKNRLDQKHLLPALDTIDQEKHGKGYIGKKADLKAYSADVMASVKRAYMKSGFSTDAANRAVGAEKRAYSRRIREAVGMAGLQQVQDDLFKRAKWAKGILDTQDAEKRLAAARRKELDTLDELIRKHKDRQRLKNMWEWLPWGRNGKFSDTPGISFGLLRHIPLLGHFGWGGGSLEDDRSDIRRQIKNAKDVNELAAIRQRYQFDERQAVYDRDLGRLREGRSWLWSTRALGLPIRSAEGEYLPSLNKMGESFMRMTNKLATAWIGVMWARMAAQSIGAPLIAMMQGADTHTRQKNMYNVSLPYGMTSGKTFEQWEDESFEKARRLRMSASEYRATVMNAAPIFHTAEYGEDYKKGRIGVDGRMHYQGERIITDMAQVERVAENLHMMARISGSSDVEMQAALRQVIQMISKGRGNIQDIRPILESGGHMGDMIARFGFGASGAADLYKLNDKKGLTADKLLTNLLSDKTSDDLRELMRRSARTWEEVAAIMKSDLNKLFLPTIRAFASESEYGLGDKLTSMTKTLADQEWLGRAIRDKLTDLIDLVRSNWYVYLSQFLRFAGTMTLMGSVGIRAFGILNQIVNRATGIGLQAFAYGDIHDRAFTVLGASEAERRVADLGSYLDSRLFGDTEYGMGGNQGVRDYLKSKGVDIDTLSGFHGKFITQKYAQASVVGMNALYELRDKTDAELENIIGKGARDYVDRAVKLKLSSYEDDVLGLAGGLHSIDVTNEEIDKIIEGSTDLGWKLLHLGEGDNLKKLVQDMEANVKKEEDERLPGHALDLQNQTAGNTGETAKNTRKANQIQLAILKQVAGTRVVNRVVHVNPNIVSNVGTIRNGIEYDQLLKDLGSTVNHAVTAYAL